MPNAGQDNDDLSDALGSEFETIHDAVNAALAVATDPAVTSSLLGEYNAARNAYTAATNKALCDSDPSLAGLMEQLKSATQAIQNTEEAAQNAAGFIDKITKAVGVFTKVISLVGGLA